jgi:hypothetical protein
MTKQEHVGFTTLSVDVVQLDEIGDLVSLDGVVDWIGCHDLVSDSVGMLA